MKGGKERERGQARLHLCEGNLVLARAGHAYTPIFRKHVYHALQGHRKHFSVGDANSMCEMFKTTPPFTTPKLHVKHARSSAHFV